MNFMTDSFRIYYLCRCATLIGVIGVLWGLCHSGWTDAAPPVAKPTPAKQPAAKQPVRGWLNWRGPGQNGTSLEIHLPDTWTPGGKNHLWTYNLAGRGTPVIANGKVYTLGYYGEGPDLQEILMCLDAETGKKLWD